MQSVPLSAEAVALFRHHVAEQGHLEVNNSRRPLYRELARAGLMIAAHTFAGADESLYKLTKLGFERKGEILAYAKEAG